MKQIKFSHRYTKFGANAPTHATLLQVFREHEQDLSKPFIEYDTEFDAGGKYGYYPLPKGEVLILLFEFHEDSRAHLFTTVRRCFPEKELYYRKAIGETFEVIVNEEQDASG